MKQSGTARKQGKLQPCSSLSAVAAAGATGNSDLVVGCRGTDGSNAAAGSPSAPGPRPGTRRLRSSTLTDPVRCAKCPPGRSNVHGRPGSQVAVVTQIVHPAGPVASRHQCAICVAPCVPGCRASQGKAHPSARTVHHRSRNKRLLFCRTRSCPRTRPGARRACCATSLGSRVFFLVGEATVSQMSTLGSLGATPDQQRRLRYRTSSGRR
jgi:hypothetical protein